MEPSGITGIIVTAGITIVGFFGWIVRRLFVLDKEVAIVKKETYRMAESLVKHELEDDAKFSAISLKLDRLLELTITANARLDTYIEEQHKARRKDC